MSTAANTWEADLYAKLSGDATLRVIVGTRIFPAPAPDGTAGPFVVWQLISAEGATTHDAPADFYRGTLQLTAWAADKSRARAALDRVIELLDAVNIAGARDLTCVNPMRGETYDADTTPRMHGQLVDFSITFNV